MGADAAGAHQEHPQPHVPGVAGRRIDAGRPVIRTHIPMVKPATDKSGKPKPAGLPGPVRGQPDCSGLELRITLPATVPPSIGSTVPVM